MSKASYIGIDPGRKGGIAYIYDDGYDSYFMPDTTSGIYKLLSQLADPAPWTTCIIEQVQVMGKSFGAKAALSYGQHYGEIIGILTALEVKVVEARPAIWKKAMGLTKEKDDSIALCERLFPDVNLLPTQRCTKPSDGMAEAVLLAEYGRRMNL